jgi:hypothetical protein
VPGFSPGAQENETGVESLFLRTRKERTMRTNRILVVGLAAILLVGVTSSVGLARRRAPSSGTWTYTDYTPDPTVLPNPGEQHCSGGSVPAGPTDVNSQKLVVKKTSTLTLTSHNALDWAMEIHNSSGSNITGSDGAGSTDPENMTIALTKGTYSVIYCNFSGEPEITVDYSLKK